MSPADHIVFVHGAWHQGSDWDDVRGLLSRCETSAIELPSVGADSAQLGDMRDDAHVVRAHVDRIRESNADGRLIVVAHSYGGVPVAEALGPSRTAGRTDLLVYVGAFLLDVGQSLLSAAGGRPLDWWTVDETRDVVDPADPDVRFYGDLSADDARAAASRLRHQRFAAFRQPLSAAAWQVVPTAYVVLDRDAAIPPPAQEAMAGHATHVRHLDSDHSPFLSQPADLARLIAEVVDRTTT